MYTIISGTNRPGSLTRRFATLYQEMLQEAGQASQVFHLEKLPEDVFSCDVYAKVKTPGVQKIQDQFAATSVFIFIFPEYNGSYPGILKLLVDVLDPKIAFAGKKAGLIGIATGRAGNLRGLDQFAAVLQHMNVTVMPYLLPVSRVHAEMAEGRFTEATQKVVAAHAGRMLDF